MESSTLSKSRIGGSNGEFVYLSKEERRRVVEAVREVIPEDRILIVGSGMESTQATIAMTETMTQAGAQVAIVVTPSYFTKMMNAKSLEHHYEQVAQASPIPILLYNVPANTGLNLPVEATIRLSAHPNIIGMKDSGGDITRIGAILHGVQEEFSVLAGSGGFLLAALVVGAKGCISALANIAATDMAELMDAFEKKDLNRARDIQLRLISVNTTVTSLTGVAGLKVAMEFLGYYGGSVRSPLLPLGENERESVRTALVEAGLMGES
jgi:4-hydroxy-2-oxoglutarate aldolase